MKISALPCLVSLALVFAAFATPASAAKRKKSDAPSAPPITSPPTTAPTSRPASADKRIAVAILDFDAGTPAAPDLGKQISEIILGTLSSMRDIRLVERASMDKILAEQGLNLAGVVDAANGIKIGKLAGAQILVTGKVISSGDKSILYVAKIIGTETSEVRAVLHQAPKDGDTTDAIMELARKLGDALHREAPGLLPPNDTLTDPLPALKSKLAGRKLPKVAVTVNEHHVAAAGAAADPAVETEFRKILIEAGFTVLEGNERDLDKAGVDLAITGEGFSEFSARIGSLVSCSARVEINAVDRKDGRVVFSDRATSRGVDLAEQTAGKTALQNAAHDLAIRFLRTYAGE